MLIGVTRMQIASRRRTEPAVVRNDNVGSGASLLPMLRCVMTRGIHRKNRLIPEFRNGYADLSNTG